MSTRKPIEDDGQPLPRWAECLLIGVSVAAGGIATVGLLSLIF